MKVAILTTETPHHARFVQEITRIIPVELVLSETKELKAPFETNHPFEIQRDHFERKTWFAGENPSLSEVSNTEVNYFPSLNDMEAIETLNNLSPDIVVVFGTGLLHASVIATCPNGMINLHGGDPEEYRGLDSHMWAIYHKEFKALKTTLHHVDTSLDSGRIIGQQAIFIWPRMKLNELRRANTEVCITLIVNALKYHKKTGFFSSSAQRKKGRMYSFMPTSLKDICVKRFEAHTSRLQ
jgi:methionyl-tRNA formyltransferase